MLKKVATPRAKYEFESELERSNATATISSTFPQLMTSTAEQSPSGPFFLFVQSVCSNIFDMNVRNVIEEKCNGVYLGMIK